uniref:Uncharacterized protein n=1 Tax=Anguilla anguilla TaxID=7936 RepID=A0A0E9WXI2_ANGAN
MISRSGHDITPVPQTWKLKFLQVRQHPHPEKSLMPVYKYALQYKSPNWLCKLGISN